MLRNKLSQLKDVIVDLQGVISNDIILSEINTLLNKECKEKETDNNCPICLMPFGNNKYTLNCCNKEICKPCLLKVFSCPYCRGELKLPHTKLYEIDKYLQANANHLMINLKNIVDDLLSKGYNKFDIACIV